MLPCMTMIHLRAPCNDLQSVITLTHTEFISLVTCKASLGVVDKKIDHWGWGNNRNPEFGNSLEGRISYLIHDRSRRESGVIELPPDLEGDHNSNKKINRRPPWLDVLTQGSERYCGGRWVGISLSMNDPIFGWFRFRRSQRSLAVSCDYESIVKYQAPAPHPPPAHTRTHTASSCSDRKDNELSGAFREGVLRGQEECGQHQGTTVCILCCV